MDTHELKKGILKVLKGRMDYPSPPDILKLLQKEGASVRPAEVHAAIRDLESEGRIARAPHYYLSD